MSEDYKKVLEAQLWNIANTLRGKMNADEFRDYILGFIFYKYLSEKMNIFADEILKQDNVKFRDITPKTADGKEFIEAIKEEALEKLGYFLRPEELFTEVAKRGKGENEDDVDKFDESKTNFILEDLQKILINIQLSTMGTDSEEDYENLFEDMDLNSSKLGKTPEARNAIIAKVLTHLDKIDFKLSDINQVDVLGDAYEYLIGEFASGAGKKAGEFYTPQQVSTILAKLVTTGKQKLKSVYDPTCGSGSLLLRVAREVEDVSNFYGQEMNRTTYNLARMNMILHGVHYRQFDIKQDDTLEHPQHIDKQFEAIVANPPFSAQWSANPLFTSDDRFSQYGRLAPSSKADFAFVQHMIYHLADNGTMAIVLPHGALFRSNAEQHIRTYLVENKNFLDAVIGLPANIFYGTGIPTCILVFKKCRENPDDILFIDASQHFEKVKTQNVLRKEDIELIVETYRKRIAVPKYSRKVSLEEIKKNEFNLNIPRYVNSFEEAENIDLDKIVVSLNKINSLNEQVNKKLETICTELKITFPKGSNVPLLNAFKKGIQNKIFTQQARFSDIGDKEFPEWKEINLEIVFDYFRGSPISKNDLVIEGQYPCIHYGELFTKYSEVITEIFSKTNLENGFMSIMGDILMPSSDVTPDGLAKASSIQLDNIILGGDMNILRPKNGYNSIFLSYLLNYNKNKIIQIVSGTTVKHIYNKDIKKLDLYMPTSEIEQNKIAELFKVIDQKISLIQAENIENMSII